MAQGTQLQSRAALTAPQDARERCHVCGAKVVVKGPGEVVIKNAILRVDQGSGRVAAKCCRCKAWVAVPLTYTG
jgi:DNA-directed RNA polymerase subunit RPC12/RpoP